MSIKIIECFTFYNELDLLTYRINILNTIIDYFIIVKSVYTHTSKLKHLIFNENKHLFVIVQKQYRYKLSKSNLYLCCYYFCC